MQTVLLNQAQYRDYLARASTVEEEMQHIENLLQNIENKLAHGSRIAATIQVLKKPGLSDASYNHSTNIIVIPYKPGVHGLYYFSNLCHEDRHADQTHGQRDAAEKMLLEISRAIYPPNERIAKGNDEPTNEYLYNYGEMDARCAEIQALNEAFTSRIKAVPPDCNIIEKDEMLKVMRETWSILRLQQSRFSLRVTQLQNIQSVLTKDFDDKIMPCSIPQAIAFLVITAPALYNAKFNELQTVIRDFRTNMQALERWTSPEFRGQTQEAERAAIDRYSAQEHQKVLQYLKNSGAHYDEFPPQDVNVEVTQLDNDRLLQWYLDAHHGETDMLYIVHIDVNSGEHAYIAHRVLLDNITPEEPLVEQAALTPDMTIEEPIIPTAEYNEIDVDCL